MLAVIGLTLLLSLSVTITTFAQDALDSEEYMAQHDGGDRAAYLQEMENSDPSFYVPPVNWKTSNMIPPFLWNVINPSFLIDRSTTYKIEGVR